MQYQGYELTNEGTITSPGKFEGEMFFILNIWDMAMDGMLDEEYEDSSEEDDYCDNSTCFYTCAVDQELIDELSKDLAPELQQILVNNLKGVKNIVLYEDDNGFIHSNYDYGRYMP